MTIGIYKLTFEGTDKVYIGLSKNIEQRYKEHLYSFNSGNTSIKLQEAFQSYGVPTLNLLIECEEHELEDLEINAIDVYDSISNGFNSNSGGSNGVGLTGDKNGRANFTNKQIIEAFNLLSTVQHTKHIEIERITGVSKTVVTSIYTGKSHTWLKELYPETYKYMVDKGDARSIANSLYGDKHSAKARGISYPQIISPDGRVFNIENLAKFSRDNGLTSSALCRVLKGKSSHHKGWRVYNGCTC